MTREEAREWLRSIKDNYIHGGDEAFDNARREALDMAVKALEQEPRWIPVSERLPEKDGEYLVTVSFHFCGEIVFKCSFAMDLHKVDEYNFQEHKCGFYGIDSEWGSYEIDNVIAWMPSPEPYKAESEE